MGIKDTIAEKMVESFLDGMTKEEKIAILQDMFEKLSDRFISETGPGDRERLVERLVTTILNRWGANTSKEDRMKVLDAISGKLAGKLLGDLNRDERLELASSLLSKLSIEGLNLLKGGIVEFLSGGEGGAGLGEAGRRFGERLAEFLRRAAAYIGEILRAILKDLVESLTGQQIVDSLVPAVLSLVTKAMEFLARMAAEVMRALLGGVVTASVVGKDLLQRASGHGGPGSELMAWGAGRLDDIGAYASISQELLSQREGEVMERLKRGENVEHIGKALRLSAGELRTLVLRLVESGKVGLSVLSAERGRKPSAAAGGGA